jgi:hypothetical protein
MNIYYICKTLFCVGVRAALALVLIAMIGIGACFSHDMPKSSVLLHYRQSYVLLELRLPVDRLEIATGFALAGPNQAIERQLNTLSLYIADRIHVNGENGKAWNVEVVSVSPPRSAALDEVRALIRLTPAIKGESIKCFRLKYEVILREIATHVAVLSVQSDWDRGIIGGRPELIGSLGFNEFELPIQRREPSTFAGFIGMFHLGIEHISDGVDHVLFLLTLLISGMFTAEGGRWRRRDSAKTTIIVIVSSVSAFTLGHSVSLAAGVWQFIRVPSEPIEILIAASVLISAVHALRPIYPGREVWIAAGFGLVHGLAFASSLSAFDLDPSHLVSAVLGFNLGIEAVQIAVVAAVVPSLLLLAKTPWLSLVRIPVAVLAGIAAIGWMFERTLGWSSPLSAIVDGLPKYAHALSAGLFFMAISAYGVNRRYKGKAARN